MITQEQAEQGINRKVVYRPSHWNQDPEEGVIVRVAPGRGAFVRYRSELGAKLTRLQDLEFLSAQPDPQAVVPRPDSVTHFICPAKASGGETHHLIPVLNGAACVYCRKSQTELRQEVGL